MGLIYENILRDQFGNSIDPQTFGLMRSIAANKL